MPGSVRLAESERLEPVVITAEPVQSAELVGPVVAVAVAWWSEPAHLGSYWVRSSAAVASRRSQPPAVSAPRPPAGLLRGSLAVTV